MVIQPNLKHNLTFQNLAATAAISFTFALYRGSHHKAAMSSKWLVLQLCSSGYVSFMHCACALVALAGSMFAPVGLAIFYLCWEFSVCLVWSRKIPIEQAMRASGCVNSLFRLIVWNIIAMWQDQWCLKTHQSGRPSGGDTGDISAPGMSNGRTFPLQGGRGYAFVTSIRVIC